MTPSWVVGPKTLGFVMIRMVPRSVFRAKSTCHARWRLKRQSELRWLFEAFQLGCKRKKGQPKSILLGETRTTKRQTRSKSHPFWGPTILRRHTRLYIPARIVPEKHSTLMDNPELVKDALKKGELPVDSPNMASQVRPC